VGHNRLKEKILKKLQRFGCVQIWIYRGGGHAGVLPLHPTRNFFEKKFLDFKKLEKDIFGNIF